MLLFILVGFVVVLYIVHHLLNNNETAKIIRKIPGPKDHFLIGNAWHIILPPDELFSLGRQFAAKFNGIYKFYAYPHVSVNIYNPEDIEIVTSSMKHHQKSDVYSFLSAWLGNGLLLSSGQKWQQRRKILTGAFHFNVLRQYFKVIEENSLRLVENLNKTVGETVNVTTVISEYTINSICEAAMGIRLDDETFASGISGMTYKNAIYKVGAIFYQRFIKIYLHPEFIFNRTSLKKKQAEVLSVVHNFTNNVIKTRSELLRDGKINIQESIDDSDDIFMHNTKKNIAMLDLLLTAEKEGLIDSSGIHEEVETFMFEKMKYRAAVLTGEFKVIEALLKLVRKKGHDTTAAGLSFFLMLMANNPSAQEKAVEELREIFGNTTRRATMDDFNKMQYLERCIKESLRLYPPVHFISRKISETVKLSNYTVPEGTFCHIHIFDLHRRPDLFEDPLKFNPDRFLPEASVGRHNFAYIPFSAGPRNCIGQKFAMMEMKSAMSAILRNFEILPVTTPSDLKLASDIILRNSTPIQVKFIRRQS